MVKHVVKSLFKAILKWSIVPKKPMFTRVFSVFRDFIMWGRCLAPKRRALPTAPHPDKFFILLFYAVVRCASCCRYRIVLRFSLLSATAATPYVSLNHPQGALRQRLLLWLRLCLRSFHALANRQVTATPFCSLLPPPAALANVPNCAILRDVYLYFHIHRTTL